jgi:hypothetical protein
MRVFPVKNGPRLRDPFTRQHILDEGQDVPADPYWLQRVAHGDVTLEAPEPDAAKPDDDAK